jgi:hypothetical protein
MARQDTEYENDGMGWKLWLVVGAITVGSLLAAGFLFLVIGAAWVRWGFVGMFIFISLVAIGFGLWYDHRHPSERADYYGG